MSSRNGQAFIIVASLCVIFIASQFLRNSVAVVVALAVMVYSRTADARPSEDSLRHAEVD